MGMNDYMRESKDENKHRLQATIGERLDWSRSGGYLESEAGEAERSQQGSGLESPTEKFDML